MREERRETRHEPAREIILNIVRLSPACLYLSRSSDRNKITLAMLSTLYFQSIPNNRYSYIRFYIYVYKYTNKKNINQPKLYDAEFVFVNVSFILIKNQRQLPKYNKSFFIFLMLFDLFVYQLDNWFHQIQRQWLTRMLTYQFSSTAEKRRLWREIKVSCWGWKKHCPGVVEDCCSSPSWRTCCGSSESLPPSAQPAEPSVLVPVLPSVPHTLSANWFCHGK